MRVVGYGRVSSSEQATEGVSLAAQEEKVRAYCGLHGLDLVAVEIDAGVSAKTLNRPALARTLARLESGEADGVVILKLDRLSRSVTDWNTLIDGYFGPGGGKQLFSVADSIDTRTAAGRMVLNIMMVIAQWEREAIVERTREALGHKRSKGERVGQVPYGWDLGDDGRTLIPSPDEQAVLAWMRRAHADGTSYRAIAAELNRRGVPTKNPGRLVNRRTKAGSQPVPNTGRWNHNAVRHLLNRPETTP